MFFTAFCVTSELVAWQSGGVYGQLVPLTPMRLVPRRFFPSPRIPENVIRLTLHKAHISYLLRISIAGNNQTSL